MSEEILLLPKIYDLMVWLTPKLGLLPRKYKYSLGDRIINALLTILERIIEARYSKKKAHFLRQCNLEIEKLRFLIRLAKDLQCLSIRAYEYCAEQLDEIGRMVGGWEKQQRGREAPPAADNSGVSEIPEV